MKNKNKIISLFLIVIFSLSLSIIYMLNNHLKDNIEQVKDIVKKEAEAYFNNIVATRHWNASLGGVYVKAKNGLKPNNYLENNHIYSKDNELLIKINPAWMTRQISEISNKSNKNYFKITSLNPLNPDNKADEFEKRALNFFDKNRDKKSFYEFNKDSSQFNYMAPLVVKESCLQCHAKQNYKIGDIRGGVHISVPTDEYFSSLEHKKKEHTYLAILIILSAITVLALFIWFINRLNSNQNTIEENFKEIKSLQEKNEELLSRYEYAVDGTQDGLWDWNLKTNEVFFSKNWKSMLGYEEDEIQNDLKEWEIRVHPEDKEQAIQDVVNNQNRVTTFYQNIHRLKHKDGTWVWILDRGKTYYDEDGKLDRMLGFHSDISTLKNLEIKLAKTKEELEQLRRVIENASIGIVITDIDANIEYINPRFCEVSGYEKEELIGQNPRILKFENDTNSEMYSDLWKIITNKKTWGGIFRNRRKDNSEYWETATILPILDENKKTINYLGIMREITKEVYLEKQLKEKEELMLSQSKNAAMGEMISMIAHQWRQPITAISLNASNIIIDIELETFVEEEVKNIANKIVEQTQYLSKTIDDFRNFFKEDKEVDEIKVRTLFDELSTIILASLKNNNVKLELDFDEDLSIRTYKSELLQVLLNIVKNAKEAFDNKKIENKTISVLIKKIDKELQLSISDNAGGIKKENMDKIFNAYFTTKEEFNGTGLGLYMSRMIIEKHLKGTIKVENDEDGAVFTIKINDLD